MVLNFAKVGGGSLSRRAARVQQKILGHSLHSKARREEKVSQSDSMICYIQDCYFKQQDAKLKEI